MIQLYLYLDLHEWSCVSLCRRNHKERRAPLHRHRGRPGSRSVGGGGREKEEEKKS